MLPTLGDDPSLFEQLPFRKVARFHATFQSTLTTNYCEQTLVVVLSVRKNTLDGFLNP